MIKKKDIIENKILLKEDFWETALMGLGFIPVVGELFDFILICRYLYKKEYLWAGLMLIALIPTVGDFIVKPFIRILKGTTETAKLATVGAKVAGEVPAMVKSEQAMVKYLSENPKMAKMYEKIVPHLNSSVVEKTAKQFDKLPGGMGNKLRMSVDNLKSVGQKVMGKQIGLGKSIGKEIAAGGKFSTGLKNFFQGERLTNYLAKNGKEPGNWLSRWYNVVYKARGDRRAMVRNFIGANKILNLFGIPNLDAFEKKFETDADFRKQLGNNPQFSSLVANTTNPADLDAIESGGGSGVGGSLLKGAEGTMGLGLIKMLARTL